MKLKPLLLTAALLVTDVSPASAQPSVRQPLVRFDLHGQLGWANLDGRDLAAWDPWDHGIAQGVAGFGWYWNDHLKTEVEFNVSSDAEYYSSRQVEVAGRVVYSSVLAKVGSTGIGVGQSYQFFRNAWFHPFVGGGVDLRWESRTIQFEPSFIFDSQSHQALEVSPARGVGPDTTLVVRPFVTLGLKAYLSQRTFFRSDLRLSFHDAIDEVALRFGFGVDF
jgi:hypothetical protein